MGTHNQTLGIAASPALETFNPPQLLAGDTPLVATQDLPILAAMNLIPQYTPLSWDDTANAFKLWAVGEKVEAITCYEVPDSASDQRAACYIAGMFNPAAIAWPGGTTEAQQLDGQSGGSLRFRALLSSDHR